MHVRIHFAVILEIMFNLVAIIFYFTSSTEILSLP